MTSPLFIPDSKNKLYFIALSGLAFGLAWSNFLMSISQIMLGIIWLAQGNYKVRIQHFLQNKTAILLCSVFLIHILWLINTSNFSYALNDLRIKLPILLLPFFFSSNEQLSQSQLRFLEKLFIAGVLIGTLAISALLQGFGPIQINDIREFPGFISHIRFALCLCFSIVLLIKMLNKKNKLVHRLISTILIIWFLWFMEIIQSGTGVSIMILLCFVYLMYKIFTVGKVLWRISFCAILILLVIGITIFVKSEIEEFNYTKTVTIGSLEKQTVNGNPYDHYLSDNKRENGVHAGIYISWKELEQEWNKRSKLDFKGYDNKNQELKFTLCRYLASKDLRKDSLGISKLTANDIYAIENGVTNYKHKDLNGIEARLQQILWEFSSFRNGEDPSGQSLVMRLVYWKFGWQIAAKNFWFGVGTGDLQQEFDLAFEKSKTELDKIHWRHSHNQYLSFLITFGIFGLVFYVLSITLPLIWNKDKIKYEYIAFLLIILISQFTEDTLETQAGVTLFAFFNSLYLFSEANKREIFAT